MTVYLAFSDESGDYRLFRTGGFVKAHPDRAEAYHEFIKQSPGEDLKIPKDANSPGHDVTRTLAHNLWLAVRLYREEPKAVPESEKPGES